MWLSSDFEIRKTLDKGKEGWFSLQQEKEADESEIQTALNIMNYRVHKTTQSAEPPTQILSISKVKVSRDTSGKITVAFSYNPLLVEKVKTIEGYKWHPDKKYWSFLDSDGILLSAFPSVALHY